MPKKWHLTFGAKIVHTKIWIMAILTWTKPLAWNFMDKNTGNPVLLMTHKWK